MDTNNYRGIQQHSARPGAFIRAEQIPELLAARGGHPDLLAHLDDIKKWLTLLHDKIQKMDPDTIITEEPIPMLISTAQVMEASIDVEEKELMSFTPEADGNFVVYFYIHSQKKAGITVYLSFDDGDSPRMLCALNAEKPRGGHTNPPIYFHAKAGYPITFSAQASEKDAMAISANIVKL